MPSFTTRVVLYDATWDDYDDLYEYMDGEGFRKTITSDAGTTYQLPDAEYDYSGSIARNEVLNKAKRAAARTQKEYSVLVTESAGRTWHNLPKA